MVFALCCYHPWIFASLMWSAAMNSAVNFEPDLSLPPARDGNDGRHPGPSHSPK